MNCCIICLYPSLRVSSCESFCWVSIFQALFQNILELYILFLRWSSFLACKHMVAFPNFLSTCWFTWNFQKRRSSNLHGLVDESFFPLPHFVIAQWSLVFGLLPLKNLTKSDNRQHLCLHQTWLWSQLYSAMLVTTWISDSRPLIDVSVFPLCLTMLHGWSLCIHWPCLGVQKQALSRAFRSIFAVSSIVAWSTNIYWLCTKHSEAAVKLIETRKKFLIDSNTAKDYPYFF